ncbi:MAG: response regulator [Desulfuromonadaceae bacterium]|nr:response regulator [Desulfuromonadaceae bacterium]MDD5107438.1 response regulator [Desulfuromonadaceae bacterium]
MNSGKLNVLHIDGRKPVILAVDDDVNNLAVVRDCLTGFNYTVLMAEDGESAVSRADYARPDLILLDIMMPGIDGYETCRQLKQQESTSDIPVIFMSALAETGHKVHGLEAGAVDYVTKPFQREELLARVGVHLKIRDLNRRLKEANELLEARVEARTEDLSTTNRMLEDEIAERQVAQEQLQEQAVVLEEKVEELQAAQVALRTSEEQLRQSQKMEAIGTLAGGVAHDFNNILTAIMGFGSILQIKMAGNTTLCHYVDDIMGAAERAAKLTHSLLAFGRKQVMETRPEGINEIVRTFDRIIRRLIGEGIELRYSLAPEELLIMGDSGQIEQVLMNLTINARDAMPKGGVISLKTERLELTEGLIGDSLRPGSYVRISVSDTGEGFGEAIRQRIFEPFFTTKEIGKGTGLGLSIVYGIIKQHGGDVTVYSEVGKGTCFKIYLPLMEPGDAGHADKPVVTATGGTETILLAEDNDGVRSFMAHALKEYGYQVIEAVNGEDALEKYCANRDRIQLVILDAVMPRMNGREVYDTISKMGEKVRVLFHSGYSSDIIEPKWIVEEGASFLTKPVTVLVLLGKVREALDKVL